eukprot:GHRR01027196.1.p2 GENE.GHRR01027196.1~~GHRR01027196.1.p2  ORF type:complete len:122 (+),score=41.86 GHRR01027196.1:197-562(+)
MLPLALPSSLTATMLAAAVTADLQLSPATDPCCSWHELSLPPSCCHVSAATRLALRFLGGNVLVILRPLLALKPAGSGRSALTDPVSSSAVRGTSKTWPTDTCSTVQLLQVATKQQWSACC